MEGEINIDMRRQSLSSTHHNMPTLPETYKRILLAHATCTCPRRFIRQMSNNIENASTFSTRGFEFCKAFRI
jgi:hypothetical protein